MKILTIKTNSGRFSNLPSLKLSLFIVSAMRTLFLLVLIISVPIASRSQCVYSETTTVSLNGTIYAKDFPGPPNFESIRAGDERMRYWIFRLDKPICVEGDSFDNDRVSNVRRLQLVFMDGSFYQRYRRYVREHRRFKVTGSLFHRNTGHHVTEILISVKTLEPFRK
jgi:hypothetical protein